MLICEIELQQIINLLIQKFANIKIDDNIKTIPKPPTFIGDLRDEFQAVGAKWINDLIVEQKYGILADEMGLGKTVQTIHGILERIQANPMSRFLLCLPRSLVMTWVRAFEKFSPKLKFIYFEPKCEVDKIIKEKIIGKPNEWNLIIITDHILDVHNLVSAKNNF